MEETIGGELAQGGLEAANDIVVAVFVPVPDLDGDGGVHTTARHHIDGERVPSRVQVLHDDLGLVDDDLRTLGALGLDIVGGGEHHRVLESIIASRAWIVWRSADDEVWIIRGPAYAYVLLLQTLCSNLESNLSLSLGFLILVSTGLNSVTERMPLFL
eukprot:GEZU01011544.1.p1 GENE.GEZU01011544.1~~GEZU01011544.1.p1  ORF type:complete len:158 (-),score=15.28 GEZU01011544.1:405-878(-)